MPTQFLAFTLPEPWVDTRFPLAALGAINFLIGPPGSGKLRFARALREHWTNARLIEAVEQGRAAEEAPGAPLERLRAALGAGRGEHLIFDLPELGLDAHEQRMFMAEARAAATPGAEGALYIITHSPHILDIAALDDACAVVYFASPDCAPRLLDPSREAVERIRDCLIP